MITYPLPNPTEQTRSAHPYGPVFGSPRAKKRSFSALGQDSSQTLRLIIFYVQERLLGLPLSMVSKVLRCPDGIQINSEGVGLLELRSGSSSQIILVVDLAHLFSQMHTPHPVQDPFMILIQSAQAEPCALPIRIMPALVDLPLADITPLPDPLRQDPTYRFVSHIATLSDMDPPQRLHIIGLDQSPLFTDSTKVSTLLFRDADS
ncbi:MAG: chemotaxis protein CheW [Thermostichus sp. HHBFW_bins_43]